MHNIYRRLLIDFEVVLLATYVLGLLVALATKASIFEALGVAPYFLVNSVNLAWSTFASGTLFVLYLLVVFLLPAISIMVHRKRYLIMNIALLLGAALSVYSYRIVIYSLSV